MIGRMIWTSSSHYHGLKVTYIFRSPQILQETNITSPRHAALRDPPALLLYLTLFALLLLLKRMELAQKQKRHRKKKWHVTLPPPKSVRRHCISSTPFSSQSPVKPIAWRSPFLFHCPGSCPLSPTPVHCFLLQAFSASLSFPPFLAVAPPSSLN